MDEHEYPVTGPEKKHLVKGRNHQGVKSIRSFISLEYTAKEALLT